MDDGSTDETPAILEEYARRCRTSGSSGAIAAAAVGPGVIEAFYAGLETVHLDHSTTCASSTSISTCRPATSSG